MLLECAWCNESFEKAKNEVDRQIRNGRSYFFCSRTCTAHHRNAMTGHKNRNIEKQCPECGEIFMSHTGKKAATFCSRSCASRGSVTEHRREQAKIYGRQNIPNNVEHLSKMMRQREAWKYVQVNTYLNELKIPHVFEYPLEDCIFDLALPEHGIFIEFDGKDHNGLVQSTRDLEKELCAERNKWAVLRVPMEPNTVIPPHAIEAIIEQFCLA